MPARLRHGAGITKPPKSAASDLHGNNTVKLTAALRQRIGKAMEVEGFTVWSEFCRVALTEKCHAIESELRTRDPAEYRRIYESRS